MARGSVFVCPARKRPGGGLYSGVHTETGTPTCIGMREMDFMRSDPQRGHLYKCPEDGCHLTDRRGVRHCADEVWEDGKGNPRLLGPLPQKSAAWKQLYALRQSVERAFKSLKESLRLEAHCIRGLAKIALHAAIYMLAFGAVVLANLLAGASEFRWMVRKVA